MNIRPIRASLNEETLRRTRTVCSKLKLLVVLLGLLSDGTAQAWFRLPDFDNEMARSFAEETYRTNKRTEPLDPADADLFDPVKFGVLIPGTETVTTNASGQIVTRKVPTRYSLAPVTNFLAKVKSEKGVRISLGKGEYCFGCLMSKVDLEEPSLPAGSVIAYVHLGGVVVWYPPEEISCSLEASEVERLLRTYQRGSGGAAGPGWFRYGFYAKISGDRPPSCLSKQIGRGTRCGTASSSVCDNACRLFENLKKVYSGCCKSLKNVIHLTPCQIRILWHEAKILRCFARLEEKTC